MADAGKRNKDLAEHLGVLGSTVSNWVTNKIQPSVADLFRIAEYLGCEPGELLNTKTKARE